MIAAKHRLRALLRGTRTGLRLAGIALDRRRELGTAGLAKWAVGRARRATSSADLNRHRPVPPPGTVFDAIFAVGYWDGEPKRYRVYNPAEDLSAAGYAVHIMGFERLGDIPRFRWRAAVLVLFRAEYDRLLGIDEVLGYARGAGMRIVYDIDDLVFDPGLADRIDGLRLMGSHQRRQFVAAMARRRRLMLACDLVTVSTAPLARAVTALGRPSAIVPNSLNEAQLNLAAEIARAPRVAGDAATIGYFSGTRTHQRDFAVCKSALFDVMERHRQLRLRLVGHLDLGPRWQIFGDRIERIGLLAPADLLRSTAETDINLAPLELGNPFSEAKSELKFFEAAVVGIPTVASATEPFVAAIEDGVSGFLVRDPEGWGRALDLLTSSKDRRTAMGQAARVRSLSRYSPAAVTPCRIAALGLGDRCRAEGSMAGLARAVRA